MCTSCLCASEEYRERLPRRTRFAPLQNITLLHSVFRKKARAIERDVSELDDLAPDAAIVDIIERLEILEQIFLAHCRAEDEAIIPALKKKVVRRNSAAQPAQSRLSLPAKRERSSPVSVSIDSCAEDHGALEKSFASLRNAVGKFLAARRTHMVPDNSTSCHRGSIPRTSLGEVKNLAEMLVGTVMNHLDTEENEILPASNELLSESEQGSLLVQTLLIPYHCSHWPRSFEYMSTEDLVHLFKSVAEHASVDDLVSICQMAYPYIESSKWMEVLRSVPQLAKIGRRAVNSYTELKHIRTVIRRELEELDPYCRNVDIACEAQLQSLANRFDFVVRLYTTLVNGEREVFVKRLEAAPLSSSQANALRSYRDASRDSANYSKSFMDCVTTLERGESGSTIGREMMSKLVNEFRAVSVEFVSNLDVGDKYLYPLLSKHLDLKDQEEDVNLVLARFSHLMRDFVPWMFTLLSVDERESLMRCFMRRGTAEEFHEIVKSIVSSVCVGTSDACEWAELCSRVPQARHEAAKVVVHPTKMNYGPVAEILRVHKAIRVDLNTLLKRVYSLPVDGTHLTYRVISPIIARVEFLKDMVEDHSKAEDDIVLPRLEERKPGSTAVFVGDHCNERSLFQALVNVLASLGKVTGERETSELVWRLRVAVRTLRDDMANHLTREESLIWPLVTTVFEREEQSKIVGLVFGNMPAERLQKLLPWLISVLSVTERKEMMDHILQVTRSTMFRKWLSSWLVLDPTKGSATSHSDAQHSRSTSEPGPSSSSSGSNTQLSERLKNYGIKQETIQDMVKAIASDNSIDDDTKTKLMQEVMLRPYIERRERQAAVMRKRNDEPDDRNATYTRDNDGRPVFGCEHYQRPVKLRAACCGKLYTCQHCHDKAEKHCKMDRSACTELMCMYCGTVQGISNRCVNGKCGKKFARYFCRVCKLYEDRKGRHLYHCPFCGVCRVGRGLGIDFFHCMKCNMCMNRKFEARHVCVEKAMDSDCPICYEYLFTSTEAVKYLPCGHLMHASCYESYAKDRINCPVCAKSLEGMSTVYEKLDAWLAQRPSSSYSKLRCEIECLDCHKRSKTQLRLLYLKCSNCNSFNTRKIG